MKNNFAYDRIPIEEPGSSASSVLGAVTSLLTSGINQAAGKALTRSSGNRIGRASSGGQSRSAPGFAPLPTSVGAAAPSFAGRAAGWQTAFSDPLLIAGLYMIYAQGPRQGFTPDELVSAALSIANWEGLMTRSAYKDAGYLGLLPAWWDDVINRRFNASEGVPEATRRYVTQWLSNRYSPPTTHHRDDPLYAFVFPVLINRALNTVMRNFTFDPEVGWTQTKPTPLIQRTIAELPNTFKDRAKGFGLLMGLANIQGSFAKLTKWDHPDRLTKDGESYAAILGDKTFLTQLKKYIMNSMADMQKGDIIPIPADDSIGMPGVAWNIAYGLRENVPPPSPSWSKGITPFITSRWGNRVAPKPGASTFHRGIDLRAKEGTPIFAPCDALVTRVKKDPGSGAGLHLTLKRNGQNVRYRFLHLQKAVVKPGDSVPTGGIIAYSGTSGQVAPHLHFEYYPGVGDTKADPQLDPAQAWRRVL